ncbi:MAG: hypothetical protein IRY85_23140 [Micromonosporaceae bacterium]|nr:hypothetical protein [Micromonosporaceae bacterium]
MSDFDEVLERLVTDPAFQAALRADPEAALRGYRLDPQERALLESQLDTGAGVDHAVEERVSKSGVFGLIGPVVSGFGLGAPPEGIAKFGTIRDEALASFGQSGPEGRATFGTLDTPSASGYQPPAAGTPAVGYETWIDADGDGYGDRFRAVERGDGGVDLYVDQNGDGVADFIGHDDNRDGLVDKADYDTDGDGVMDTRLVDVNGDGWLDREVPYSSGTKATFGTTGDPTGYA